MPVAFTAAADQEIKTILARYPVPMAALIPVLFLAQREFGYLTQEVLELVAARLELPAAKVLNTATFYTMLHKRPMGRHHVQVCKTLSCFLRGSDHLLACLERKLGVAKGETTADRLFTLETVECLAACGTAPVVRVDDVYHEELTPAAAEALIDQLRAAAAADPAPAAGASS